jgi:hypothetical protein
MDAGAHDEQVGTGTADISRVVQALRLVTGRGGGQFMKLLIELASTGWIAATQVLQVVQPSVPGDDLCGVSGDAFDGDASLKYSTEVRDAQEEHDQHREDEGELHHRLPAVCVPGPETEERGDGRPGGLPKGVGQWNHVRSPATSGRAAIRADPSTNPPVLFDEMG